MNKVEVRALKAKLADTKPKEIKGFRRSKVLSSHIHWRCDVCHEVFILPRLGSTRGLEAKKLEEHLKKHQGEQRTITDLSVQVGEHIKTNEAIS